MSLHGDVDHSDSTPVTKRRRIALSCTDCRKRKLKCDREYPICSRCREGRHPERCTYDPNAVEEIVSKPFTVNGTTPANEGPSASNIALNTITRQVVGGPSKSTAALESRIEQLENRIVGLERIINSSGKADSGSLSTRPYFRGAANIVSGYEFLDFRGKGCGTTFHGASHPQGYLAQMPTLRIFVREMVVQHQRAKQVRDQLKKSKFKRPRGQSLPLNHKSLLALLPEKEIVDHYVKYYIDTFEYFYRVLHVPSFWLEYERLWESPEETESMFVVHVMLMVAAVYCLAGHNSNDKFGINRDLLPAAQDTACYWIEECESWLDVQSQKHSTLAYMQGHCLLYIAKTMQSFKVKRAWMAAGTLMSSALIRGFHRNTNIVNQQQGDEPKIRVSRFSQEMRRRLWSTITELEFYVAVERGMPPMLPDLISDCGPPSNCDDDALSPGIERDVSSLPTSTFTRTSYQSITSKSLLLRQQVLSVINGSASPTQSEFDTLADDLTKSLEAIPNWTSPEAIFSTSLLQLQHLELIMFLHRSQLSHAQAHAKSSWSGDLHVKAAKAILDTHSRLTNTNQIVLTALRHDMNSAALAICYDFLTTSAPSPPLKMNFFTTPVDHLAYLSTALSILDKKIDWTGVGMKAFYVVAACEGLVKKCKEYAGNQEAIAGQKVTALMEKMVRRFQGSRSVSMAERMSSAGTPNTTVSAPAVVNGASSAAAEMGPGGEALLINSAELGDFSFDLQDWDLNSFLNF